MAIFKQTSFENGSIGVKATTTTAEVDTLGAGSASHPQFVSDGVDGTQALEFDSSTATMYLAAPGSTTAYYMRMYIKVVDSENDNRYLMTVRGTGGGGKALDVRREGDGTVTIRNINTATDSTAAGFMPVGDWVRFELFVDVGAATQELRLFKGANLHGTTPDDTLTGPCGALTTIDNMGAIPNAATNQVIRYDAFAIGDSWVGAISGGGGGATIDKETSFESGTVGAKADATSAEVDTLSGGSASHPQFVSDGVDGTQALEFDADTATMWLSPSATVTEYYLRAYVKIVDTENVDHYIMSIRGGGSKAQDVRVEGDGTVVIRNVNTAADSTAAGFMSVGEWVRFEIYVDASGGSQELRLFKGANLHGTTPDDTLTGACGTLTAIDSMGVSSSTITNQVFRYDALAIGDDWIGPVSGGGSGSNPKPSILGTLYLD